jgi:pimeloyl-ACP methyl ester carboxylesterase
MDGWAWKFDPQIQVDDMHGAAWWGEQVPRFAHLDVPRAVLHGELSAVMPPVAVDHVRASVPPDVPVVAVPYAHHHLMLDQPLAFVAAVRALIARW